MNSRTSTRDSLVLTALALLAIVVVAVFGASVGLLVSHLPWVAMFTFLSAHADLLLLLGLGAVILMGASAAADTFAAEVPRPGLVRAMSVGAVFVLEIIVYMTLLR